MSAGGDSAAFDLLRSAFSFAGRTNDTLTAWREREGRTAPSSANSLARIVQACVEQLQRELSSEFALIKGDANCDPYALSVIKTRVEAVQVFLDVVVESASRSLHPVLSPTVTTLLRDLGIDGQVLVTGTRTQVYELMTWPRELFLSHVPEDELRSIELPFLVFLVPRPPLDWPINYCLLFHEVGHAVFAKRNVISRLVLSFPPELALRAPDDESFVRLGKLRTEYEKALRKWVEEVFADIFGLLSVGPAYLHCLANVLGADGTLQQCSKVHPSTAIRIAILGEIATSRELLETIPPLAKASIEWWLSEAQAQRREFSHGSEPLLDEFALALGEAAVECVPVIIAEAEAILESRLYSVEDGSADLRRAQQIERWNMPAVEEEVAGAPLGASRIFASNWAAYYLGGDENAPDWRGRMREYGERLLNSLDAAEAIRAWERAGR